MYVAKATDDLNTNWHFTNAVFQKLRKRKPFNEYFCLYLNKYGTLLQFSMLIFPYKELLSCSWQLAFSPHWSIESTMQPTDSYRGLKFTEFDVLRAKDTSKQLSWKNVLTLYCDKYGTFKHLLYISLHLRWTKLANALKVANFDMHFYSFCFYNVSNGCI